MSNCKSCGARLIWMKTEKGKTMPVDYDSEIEHEEEFDPDRMRSHWDTCVSADQHRKVKKPKEEDLFE